MLPLRCVVKLPKPQSLKTILRLTCLYIVNFGSAIVLASPFNTENSGIR